MQTTTATIIPADNLPSSELKCYDAEPQAPEPEVKLDEQKYYQPIYRCDDCEDRGWVFLSHGVRECDCKKKKYREAKLAAIPLEYENLRLETMMPMKHPKQSALLGKLRNDPYKS